MIVWKAVRYSWRDGRATMLSAVVDDDVWTLSYKLGEQTYPKEGSAIYAFPDQSHALQFGRRETVNKYGIVILECEAWPSNIFTSTQPLYCTRSLPDEIAEWWRSQEYRETYSGHAPLGTVMVEWVKPTKASIWLPEVMRLEEMK